MLGSPWIYCTIVKEASWFTDETAQSGTLWYTQAPGISLFASHRRPKQFPWAKNQVLSVVWSRMGGSLKVREDVSFKPSAVTHVTKKNQTLSAKCRVEIGMVMSSALADLRGVFHTWDDCTGLSVSATALALSTNDIEEGTACNQMYSKRIQMLFRSYFCSGLSKDDLLSKLAAI